MQIKTYGDNLTQLTRYTIVNCFLVREDDGMTLVDTGLSGSAQGILDAAAKIGGKIRRIVLTHAHSDHVGSLDVLHERLPDAEILIGAREARFLAGDKTLDANEQHDKLRGGFSKITTRPTRTLNPGDRVGSLEVIASPGHTPGHIALLDTRDRTLIAGDAYTVKGGLSTGGTFRLLFPLPAWATWSKSVGVRSAEALIALQPSRLAVGHGDTMENPVAAMRAAIDEAKQKSEG